MNDTFRFEVVDNSESSNDPQQDDGLAADEVAMRENYIALKTVLDECGITVPLAPTWYPEGCVMNGPPGVEKGKRMTKIVCEFFVDDTPFFSIVIRDYSSPQPLAELTTEGTYDSKEDYPVGDMLFLITDNNNVLTAAWSNSKSLCLNISGNISEETLKELLDSIIEVHD